MLPQYPHHMTYAPAKFKVSTSNGLEGYAFEENTLLTLTLGSIYTCIVLSSNV